MQDIEKILRHPFSGVGGLFNDIEDVSFVPTCVGLFDGYHLRGKENAVHPHVRGVNAKPGIMFYFENGSSPRAWG